MRDLTAANRIISEIAEGEPNITPITADDFPLFKKFFDQEPHTYGNSWTYITQGMYGIGSHKLGYKYYDGKNLSAVCVYPKIEHPEINVFYWIRPMGEGIIEVIEKTAKKLLTDKKIPTYAKKLFPGQFEELKKRGFKDTLNFPWHSLYPMEDDCFPEQIIDIKNTITTAEKLGKNRRLNSALRYYQLYQSQKNITFDRIINHKKEAKEILRDFFIYSGIHSKMPVISGPEDYYAMILGLSSHENTIDKLFFYQGKSSGFYFIEKQDVEYASQYALISLRQLCNNLADYMMFDVFNTLLLEGVSYVNLGGSENSNLNMFKEKFRPIRENHMFWATLY